MPAGCRFRLPARGRCCQPCPEVRLDEQRLASRRNRRMTTTPRCLGGQHHLVPQDRLQVELAALPPTRGPCHWPSQRCRRHSPPRWSTTTLPGWCPAHDSAPLRATRRIVTSRTAGISSTSRSTRPQVDDRPCIGAHGSLQTRSLSSRCARHLSDHRGKSAQPSPPPSLLIHPPPSGAGRPRGVARQPRWQGPRAACRPPRANGPSARRHRWYRSACLLA